MKKLIIILFSIFLLTGCTKGEEVTCNINGKEAIFTIKNGLVTKYKLAGEKQKKSEIDEINGEYFTSSDDNEEGKLALQTYVSSLGGTCN